MGEHLDVAATDLELGPAAARRFVELRLLGAGGMGAVFAARDLELQRLVAVKALLDRGNVNPQAASRLRREAKAMARVSHPNVVRVLDVLLDGPSPYLVMEFLEGEPLSTLVRRQRPDRSRLLSWSREAASGLLAIHEAGLVHRDVKPANLFVTTAGPLKVMDLGLARALDPGVFTQITRTGQVMGTMAYLAPELLRGGESTVRSDLYALAATIYEVLSGRQVFSMEALGSVLAGAAGRLPVPEPLGVGPALDAALAASLAADPAERPGSVALLRDALVASLGAVPAPGPTARQAPAPLGVPPGPVKSRRLPEVVGSWLVALGLLGVFLGFWARLPARPPTPGVDFTNAAGMKLVWIPPGQFLMGTPSSESEHDSAADERPQHEVRLTRGFWMGACEVTQGEWEAVMSSNPSTEKGARRPVEFVSWFECQEFCRRLTEREQSGGRLPPGLGYRLATDAEWEYACRAGTTGARYGEVDAVAWSIRSKVAWAHDVGQKQPNAWGLYDMLGNVWEWCQDGKRTYAVGAETDPIGPDGGDRVVRGGGYTCDREHSTFHDPLYAA